MQKQKEDIVKRAAKRTGVTRRSIRDTRVIKILIELLSVCLFLEKATYAYGSTGGCQPGFAGEECKHECSSSCTNSLCHLDKSSGTFPCSIGCTPGFYGLQCNTPCHKKDENYQCDQHTGYPPVCNGTMFGQNCNTTCKCSGFACDNKGQCGITCKAGWYGSNCNIQCERTCKICDKGTGRCVLESKTHLSDCKERTGNKDESSNMTGISDLLKFTQTLLVFIGCIVALVTVFFVFKVIKVLLLLKRAKSESMAENNAEKPVKYEKMNML